MIPHLTAALRAAINSPFLIIPVLNSVVVAERRPPQLNGQLFVLFSLKGGERSLVSYSFSLGVICDTPSGARAKGLGAEATDHFANAVLECGDNGAQAPQLQDHAGQLVTRDAADGLQILRLVANVVSADGRAGAVYHIVVQGEKDIGCCQERKDHHEKSNGRSSHSCSHQPAPGVPSWRDIKPGVKDTGGGNAHMCITL